MTMVGRNLHDLVRKVGVDRTRATHLAMRQALRDIERFSAAEGIDARISRPGILTVADGPKQDMRSGRISPRRTGWACCWARVAS
jgi:hypothetical protein